MNSTTDNNIRVLWNHIKADLQDLICLNDRLLLTNPDDVNLLKIHTLATALFSDADGTEKDIFLQTADELGAVIEET